MTKRMSVGATSHQRALPSLVLCMTAFDTISGLNRNYPETWNLNGVVYYKFFLKYRTAIPKNDLVHILAGVEDLGLLTLHGLENHVIRLHDMRIAILTHDADVRHQVPEITLREDAGIADSHHAVFHHVAAVAEHRGERMVPLNVDAGDNFV